MARRPDLMATSTEELLLEVEARFRDLDRGEVTRSVETVRLGLTTSERSFRPANPRVEDAARPGPHPVDVAAAIVEAHSQVVRNALETWDPETREQASEWREAVSRSVRGVPHG